MIFRLLALCLVLYSAMAAAQGRKPAVEDFVGIEVEEAEVAPHGTESLYNLQQDISKIEAQKDAPPKPVERVETSSTEFNPTMVFVVSLALSLPMIVWFLVMAHLKKKASLESASNIEVLEKYRRDREKKSDQQARKAS